MKSWIYTTTTVQKNPTYEGIYAVTMGYGNVHAAEMALRDGSHVFRTYSDYDLMTKKASGWYGGKIKKNDFVGIICATDMDWPVIFWSLLRAGARPILLNPSLDDGALARLLIETKAVGYVCEQKRDIPVPFFPKADILSNETVGRASWADEVALCTAGTVGDSRIFIYDGKSASELIMDVIGMKEYDSAFYYDPAEMELRYLVTLPFYHVFGFMTAVIWYPALKSTLIFMPNRSTATIQETCVNNRVTHLFAVPILYNTIANMIVRKYGKITPENAPSVRKALFGDQIQFLASGGSHLPHATAELFYDLGIPIHNGFGMTEASVTCIDLSSNPESLLRGYVGKPFSSIEFKIDDEGELYIRGSSMHSAKVVNGKIIKRNPKEWFPTGDIAHMQNGNLYVDGRKKDVILNSTGENVYPDDLETYFVNLPGIRNFSVLGVPNPDNQVYDDPILVVEPAENFSEEEFIKAVTECCRPLSINRKPVRFFISSVPLPLSGALKVRRQEVKSEIIKGTFQAKEVFLNSVAEKTEGEKGKDRTVSENAALNYLTSMVAGILNRDASSIHETDHLIYDLSMDSMDIINLFTQTESDYNIFFNDAEMRETLVIKDIARVITNKLNGEEIVPDTALLQANSRPENQRITDFTESIEYKQLQSRIESTFRDKEMNPYFVAHDSIVRDTSIVKGRKVINLGSYNYLGMSGNPETAAAAKKAIDEFGMSASGSRTLAGEKTIYQTLEKKLAEFKHAEDCIVCTSGWGTNVTFISSFMKKGDLVVYDQLSHNSIVDGIRLSEAESKAFPHDDLKVLEQILQGVEGKYRKVMIVIEGVYSMDGDIAPIPEFVRLKKKYGCFLMVDEAHSTGVIGEHGGGVDDYFDLDPKDIDFKIGTLSKALGTCGGYIAADHAVIEYLRYSMDGFVFSAGINPGIAAAVIKAIELIQKDNSLVRTLHQNIDYFLRRAKEEGLNTGLSKGTAIIPVLVGEDADAAILSHDMLMNGVFVPPAMYPAVPKGQSRLRFSVSAVHTKTQLERAISVCSRLMRDRGLIH